MTGKTKPSNIHSGVENIVEDPFCQQKSSRKYAQNEQPFTHGLCNSGLFHGSLQEPALDTVPFLIPTGHAIEKSRREHLTQLHAFLIK